MCACMHPHTHTYTHTNTHNTTCMHTHRQTHLVSKSSKRVQVCSTLRPTPCPSSLCVSFTEAWPGNTNIYIYIVACVCLSVYVLCVIASVCVYICVSVCLCVSDCICVFECVCIYVCLSLCVCVCMDTRFEWAPTLRVLVVKVYRFLVQLFVVNKMPSMNATRRLQEYTHSR